MAGKWRGISAPRHHSLHHQHKHRPGSQGRPYTHSLRVAHSLRWGKQPWGERYVYIYLRGLHEEGRQHSGAAPAELFVTMKLVSCLRSQNQSLKKQFIT